jgi:hypothetical protein
MPESPSTHGTRCAVTVPEQGPGFKVHFDAPSDEAMTAFTLDNAQQGTVRTESCRAFTREESEKILKAI